MIRNLSIVEPLKLTSILIILLNSTVCFSQWEQANGPYGATVSCIKQYENKIYCGISGGLVMSEDNGNTWTNIFDPLYTSLAVNAIVFLEDTIFIGTSYGVYRSDDNGSTWLDISNGLTSNIVYTMEVLENKLFAGTAQGLHKYTLGLNYWNRVLNGIGIQPISCLQSKDNNIYAGTFDNGIYISSNQGTTWTPLNTGLNGTNIKTFGLCSSGLLCAIPSGIYLYSEQDSSWTELAPIYNINSISSRGDTIMTVQNWQYPNFSFDGGETWVISNNIDFQSIFKGSLIGSGFYLTGEIAKGIYKSNDGTMWFSSNAGLCNSTIYSLAENNGKVFAATGGMGLYTTENNGNSWEQNFEGRANLVAINNDVVYASSNYGFIKSTDNGLNWMTINNGLPSYEFSDLLFIDNTIYATIWEYGVYKLEDPQESWYSINNGITNQAVTSIARNGDTIYVGSSNKLFYSINDGLEWNTVDTYTDDYISDILVYNGKILVGSLSGLYISSDNGQSWDQLTNVPVACLYETEGWVFIGYNFNGIYRLSVDATSQFPVNEGIESATILAIVSNNDTIISSVDSNGAYRIALSEIVSNQRLRIDTYTHRIHPNPVKQNLLINLNNWYGEKKIEILNLNGQVIFQKLSSESQVEIDLNIASGFYFIRISTPQKVETLKFEFKK